MLARLIGRPCDFSSLSFATCFFWYSYVIGVIRVRSSSQSSSESSPIAARPCAPCADRGYGRAYLRVRDWSTACSRAFCSGPVSFFFTFCSKPLSRFSPPPISAGAKVMLSPTSSLVVAMGGYCGCCTCKPGSLFTFAKALSPRESLRAREPCGSADAPPAELPSSRALLASCCLLISSRIWS